MAIDRTTASHQHNGTHGAAEPDTGPAAAAPQDGTEDEGLFAAAARAGVQAMEIADHVSTLFQVRADRARLAVRRSLTRALVLVLALAALVALIAAGAVHFAAGVIGGFTALFAERPWLGQLVGGAVCLAGAATIAWAAVKLRDRRELRERAAKYEERRRQHEARFGAPAEQDETTERRDGAEERDREEEQHAHAAN